MLMRAPMSALTSVDLPTLGAPTTAIRPQRNGRADSFSGVGDLLISRCRRRLLGGAAIWTGPGRGDAKCRYSARDLEGLLMRFPADGGDCVFRHGQSPPLQPLLKARLRI